MRTRFRTPQTECEAEHFLWHAIMHILEDADQSKRPLRQAEADAILIMDTAIHSMDYLTRQ